MVQIQAHLLMLYWMVLRPHYTALIMDVGQERLIFIALLLFSKMAGKFQKIIRIALKIVFCFKNQVNLFTQQNSEKTT